MSLPNHAHVARSVRALAAAAVVSAACNPLPAIEDAGMGAADAGTPPGPATPMAPCLQQLDEGIALPDGLSIVACGLAPGSELVDVVDGLVLTTSPRGAFFRDDTRVGERTRLYRTFANDRTATYVDGQIVFDGWLGLPDGRLRPGMLAIPSDVATPADGARVVSDAIGYAVGGRVLTDGLVRYVGETGRQSVLELDVRTGETRRLVNGTAIGLSASWLYYCDVHGEVRRLERDGAQDQWLAPASVPAPHCGAEVRAVDEDGIYLTRQDAPYEIWHFGPEGGETFVGTGWEGNVEVMVPPPARLFVSGVWLYVLHQPRWAHGTGAYDFLTRIGIDRAEQHLVTATDLGTPLFRGGDLYVALTRDRLDGPVDGVVLRIDASVLARDDAAL